MIRAVTACIVLCVFVSLPSVTQAQSAAPEKPWRVSVSAGTGWNSNPAAVGNTIGTAGDPIVGVAFLRDLGSAFGRFTFDGSYDFIADNQQILTVGYGLHVDIYEKDVEEVNQHRHNFWVGYQRKLSDEVSVSFQLADEYINLGDNSLSNTILLEPSLYYRFADWGSVEFLYSVGFMEQSVTPIAAGFDRDGTFHDLGFTFYLDVPNTELQARIGYKRRWNFTEGSNGGSYDYTSDFLIVGLSHPLPFDIFADFSFTRRQDNYDGIAVGAGDFRNDTVDFFTINLTRPITDSARIYVRYDHIEASSDGTLFDYRQRVIATGVIWDF